MGDATFASLAVYHDYESRLPGVGAAVAPVLNVARENI
jgi:hypothetical protein